MHIILSRQNHISALICAPDFRLAYWTHRQGQLQTQDLMQWAQAELAILMCYFCILQHCGAAKCRNNTKNSKHCTRCHISKGICSFNKCTKWCWRWRSRSPILQGSFPLHNTKLLWIWWKSVDLSQGKCGNRTSLWARIRWMHGQMDSRTHIEYNNALAPKGRSVKLVWIIWWLSISETIYIFQQYNTV